MPRKGDRRGNRGRFFSEEKDETKGLGGSSQQQQQLIEETPQEPLAQEYLLFSFEDIDGSTYNLLSSGCVFHRTGETGDVTSPFFQMSEGSSRAIDTKGGVSVTIFSNHCRIVEPSGKMYIINYPDSADPSIQEVVGEVEGKNRIIEPCGQVLLLDDVVLQPEANVEGEIMLEREEELELIARQMSELRDMFGDVSSLLQEQQERIDKIVENSAGAHASTERGLEHVKDAEEIQRKEDGGCIIS